MIPGSTLLLAAALSPALPTGGVPNLAGSWAQLQVTTSVVDVPMAGPSEAELRTLALLEVSQVDDQLRIRETVCGLESDGPSRMIDTEYPPAFSAALSGRERQARLRYQDGRWRYEEPRTYRCTGASLRDPAHDTLPIEPLDPRVGDPDADGKPGVTVRVRGWVEGEVYLVQKGWSELSGVVRNPRQIEGQVAWASEQRVLDATSRMLTKTPAVQPHPSQTRSYFRMARVPRKATCADLLPRAHRLFGI
jgi:hypothetical protein